MNATDYESVVIAVLTYQRPDELKLIVPRLLEQAASVPVEATVLVIDNSPEGNARGIVEEFDAWNLHFANEVQPGISAGRNRALAESADVDLLVFIDDDELPSKEWLRALLVQYGSCGAAAVVGPVVADFSHEPSPWIVDGEVFTRRNFASGTRQDAAATSNLLLDLRQIRAMGLSFDERFGLSGGSDTLFTRQLVERGGSIIWCHEAIVVEPVPVGRLTREWVLRRSFRSGNSWSRVSLVLASSSGGRFKTRIDLSTHGGARLLGGASRFLLGLLLRNVKHRAKGLQTTARGAGMISGACGYVYSEYRRKTG
ncbi:glycosyltransferase [Arthrobacter sp. H35-D1]|uniref:glycosyltransferase family 2 protein n=1 Tax=Arthrobacter sp. H35-D1 TaxID=3046202 RepID=UPI0024BA7710|nr:glycosyltransferase [Arthrobacter sp. H35-D1]MDJ0312328.1 glycosyltransferase [Arthrobacter sp. H35-D1]